jgi:hypothetical protein
MTNRVVLTLVFTLSFMSYMTPDLSTSVQLAPLGLFAALVFFRVIWSKSILNGVSSLFEVDGLLYVLFISMLIVAPSVASDSGKSIVTAILIAICLVLARIYMVVVPVHEVLEAFFWSGIVSIGLFTLFSFASLAQSIQTLQRFSAFNFHPNLLAFLLAGYFCVMVWKFITGDWRMKVLTGVFGSLCLVITFFASSRGSIVGILAGCLFATGIAVVRARREGRKDFVRFGLFAAAALLGLFLYIQDLEWTQNTYAFVDRVLQLTQEHRGIDSGFSGRFDKWNATLNLMSGGGWFLGKGVRSSDAMSDELIDNSYLVILYEVGLIPLLLITWRYLGVSRRSLSGYLQSTDKEQRYVCLTCGLLMAVFLVNNVVARFLFSVGNPYSLLALLFFATPASRMQVSSSPTARERKPSAIFTNRSISGVSPSL